MTDQPRDLADQINALPGHLRRYIADLEQRADPAGDVRRAHVAEETAQALAKRVEELEQPRPAVGVDEALESALNIISGGGYTGCALLIRKALDRSAQECEQLKCSITDLNDRLEESHQECAGVKESLGRANCREFKLMNEVEDMQSRLASYDACLTQVQTERALFTHELEYVRSLELREAANRNAIKLHLETIALVTRERDEARGKLTKQQDMTNIWHTRSEAHRGASQAAEKRIERLEASMREAIDCNSCDQCAANMRSALAQPAQKEPK